MSRAGIVSTRSSVSDDRPRRRWPLVSLVVSSVLLVATVIGDTTLLRVVVGTFMARL